MERIFQIAAVVFVLAAVYFLWVSNSDWAFAMGILASASFFLSVRFQMKARNDARARQKQDQ
jgi:hypothetical protein